MKSEEKEHKPDREADNRGLEETGNIRRGSPSIRISKGYLQLCSRPTKYEHIQHAAMQPVDPSSRQLLPSPRLPNSKFLDHLHYLMVRGEGNIKQEIKRRVINKQGGKTLEKK